MILLVCGVCCAEQALAQQPMTLEDAIATAVENSPSLATQKVAERSAEQARIREQTRYVPLANAEGGIRRGQTPQQSPMGVRFITTQAITTQAGLAYRSAWGTQLSGNMNLERSVSDSVILGNLGTVWGVGMTLAVTQPWRRGFGTEIGRASLRDAEFGIDQAELESARIERQLAREVRLAYWQLWYTDREIEIAEQALEITKQAREQGIARISVGLGAGIDVITLDTEIASAEERLVIAQNTRRSRQIELARLLGVDISEAPSIEITATPPAARTAPAVASVRESARQQSPELARLVLERERAEIAVLLAEDQARMNLETIGSVNINGLGSSAGEAFSQFARFEAVVGYLGVRAEIPLWRDTLHAEAERTRLALARIEAQEREVRVQLDASSASLVNDLEAATARAELAQKTASLAAENVEATTNRFEIGQATSLDIVQVLQRQREAELRAARARVDQELARVAIENLTEPLVLREEEEGEQ
jgi:outer membrane protein TolC